MVEPFHEFVLKIHSRCDLACDYCYVYTKADQRWRSRPKVMSSATMWQTGQRIAVHARDHGLTAVDVVLHGGEPLLAGRRGIAECVALLREPAGGSIDVRISMQTNGILLDEEWIRLLRQLAVRVAVSLDGDRAAHDRHRKRADGTGSHTAVSRALRALSAGQNRLLFNGLLCAVDVRNDPVTTYQSLLEFQPPRVDFLLPQGNWLYPPPGREPGASTTPYADWLIAVFDRWYGHSPPETRIRMFDEIIAVLLGGRSRLESVGLAGSSSIVVETDGGIERSDMLTATFEGAAVTGLNVATDSFDNALPLMLPDLRAPDCLECDIYRICGGGLYAHRFGPVHGFRNASVYCLDLYKLLSHIRDRVRGDVAALRRSWS